MTEQLTLFEMPEPVRQTAPAITSEGDSVHLGRHLLRCEDCISVMAELEDESIDSIVTDPPYGITLMAATGIAQFLGWPGLRSVSGC